MYSRLNLDLVRILNLVPLEVLVRPPAVKYVRTLETFDLAGAWSERVLNLDLSRVHAHVHTVYEVY